MLRTTPWEPLRRAGGDAGVVGEGYCVGGVRDLVSGEVRGWRLVWGEAREVEMRRSLGLIWVSWVIGTAGGR